MNYKALLAASGLMFAILVPLRAHRLEGLVQSSLVEVKATQVAVEVTLVPGIDIAPKFRPLLDPDGDGVFSGIETDAWTRRFMAGQTVTADGHELPLVFRTVRASPLEELNGGHAEIVVSFTADLGKFSSGKHIIKCFNRYEPIPCTFQCDGIVPREPGVRIASHRREEREQVLSLTAEFSAAASRDQPSPREGTAKLQKSVAFSYWAVGAIAIVAIFTKILAPRRPASNARHQAGPNL